MGLKFRHPFSLNELEDGFLPLFPKNGVGWTMEGALSMSSLTLIHEALGTTRTNGTAEHYAAVHCSC